MDFLKSAVASAITKGPAFPYAFGDAIDIEESIWTLHNGTKREDGSACSIFSFDITRNKSRLPLAKNALRKLRTLRHPGIIKVLDTVETEAYIYIATEKLVPLGWHIRRKALRDETLKWGLYTVAKTLKFINDEGSSIHGNVRASSIFTSESGEWKIGGLDVLSSMKEDDAVIYTYAGLVPDINRHVPPEIGKGGWDALKRSPITAVDAYMYGLLIFEAFNGGVLGMDSLVSTKNIPPSINQSYKRLLNSNPKARLSVSHFLEQASRNGGFFDTPLIRLSEGVDSLGLKTDAERAEILSELDEVSDEIPEEFLKMKILPELLKSVEFGGGGPKVFGFVMKVGARLSDDEYEALLNPVILRLFTSPDRQIRVCLLDNLSSMIDHFSPKVVTNNIFPQVVTGFSDLVPVVREHTVKSVLTLVTKLSDRTINGDLLKHLARTSNDEQPGIRTNTTICLGKIARNLGASTRAKVLTAAFTRSLRDPFVHARNAALQALAATSDLYSEEDCSVKILPAICPSLVDREMPVREQANKTVDVFLARIRKYAATMPDSAQPPASTTQSNGPTPRIGTPVNDTSWSGWAISSFTNKLAGAKGDIQPKPSTTTVAAAVEPRSSSVPASGIERSKLPLRSIGAAMNSTAPTSVPLITKIASEVALSTSGGPVEGDDSDNEWGGIDDDDSAAAFFDASPPSTHSVSSPNPFDDGSEPDFAGWLNAKAAAKTKAPLPKGLSRLPNSGSAKSTTIAKPATSTRTGMTAKRSLAAPPKVVETKVVDTKPKDDGGEDDWGDAW